ncbi:hypothetical protein ANCCAN_29428, partial [Ancylostoma caninum]
MTAVAKDVSGEIRSQLLDVKMERDGVSRIDVTLEVCQYQTEREHCIEDKMTEIERK